MIDLPPELVTIPKKLIEIFRTLTDYLFAFFDRGFNKPE